MGFSRIYRNFIRRHTKPKDPYTALGVSRMLTLVYAFCAWNALGLVFIHTIRENSSTKNSNKDSTSAIVDNFNLKKDTIIISFSGLKPKRKYYQETPEENTEEGRAEVEN